MGFQLDDDDESEPDEDGYTNTEQFRRAHTLNEDILGRNWRFCEPCSQYHLPGQACYPWKED